MRILFLGCGYLGYNLSCHLAKSFPVEVLGIESPYSHLVPSMTYMDVFQEEDWENIDIEGCVVVDTVALLPSNQDGKEEELLSSIEERYLKLLSILKRKKIAKYVFCSSGGTVYGNQGGELKEESPLQPETIYAKSKCLEETWIQESGIPYLILRIANPYGGYQIPNKSQGVIPILIRCALKNEPFPLWNSLESERDYIEIEDLASVFEKLISSGIQNEIFNVGSGVTTSLGELIHLVEEELHTSIVVEEEPSNVPVVYQTKLSIEKLKSQIDFEPKVSIREGIRKEIQRIVEEENR